MPFKAFRFLFIILNFKVVFLMENCVHLNWSHKFNYNFFRNDSPNSESKVLNVTKHCLQNHLASNTCKTPAVNVSFPLISGTPNITLDMLHRPVLATKEASTNIAWEVLHAFEKIWQLFVLCLMAAILSGILIWFFVSILKSFLNISILKALLTCLAILLRRQCKKKKLEKAFPSVTSPNNA